MNRLIRAEKAPHISQKFIATIKKEWPNWIFLLPFIIGFLVFIVYPLGMSIVYSLTDYNGITIKNIGFFNYADIFSFRKYGLGKQVFRSFGLTALYTVISLPINTVLSYMLALALHKPIKGIKVLRLLFYLPVLIPSIVSGQVWIDILRYPDGLINQWAENLGIGPFTFFQGESTQLATLITIGQWTLGGSMIVWLAALSNISPELYEAAQLDGAKYFRKLFSITLPLTTPIIFYNVVCLFIMNSQMFDSYAYLNRGINDGAYFISIRIYLTAFGTGHQYGLACAMAWILFVVIAALTALMFKCSKWVYYGE